MSNDGWQKIRDLIINVSVDDHGICCEALLSSFTKAGE